MKRQCPRSHSGLYNAFQTYPAFHSHVPTQPPHAHPTMARQQQQDFGHRLDEHEHRLKFVEQRVRAMEDQAQIHMYDDVDIYHNAYSFHGHRQGQGPVPFM